MKKVLGLDLGTSSIKCLATGFGEPLIVSMPYQKDGPEGMLFAFRDILSQLRGQIDLRQIEAIGLTGQVGSYICVSRDDIYNIKLWLPWYVDGRELFLGKVLSDINKDDFFKATGMYHPSLYSYPLPNILYINHTYLDMLRDCILLQPKDWICGILSGKFLSDAASWRGLANWDTKNYAPDLMEYADISENCLPVIQEWTEISRQGSELTGLKEGTPIAVGYGDFYSALVGMGIGDNTSCFDITGTSEHFGVITDSSKQSSLILGRFGGQGKYVHYGVTASSGKSIDMARVNFGPAANGVDEPRVREKAPIFLSYVRGERAPVFDSLARGVFCGVSERCVPEDFNYSVYEGVVFSLYDIYHELGCPEVNKIVTTGGASKLGILGKLKASLFSVPVYGEKLNCGSAMGAVKTAGGDWERQEIKWEPDPSLTDTLRYRFNVYKRMYKAWTDMTEGLNTSDLFW